MLIVWNVTKITYVTKYILLQYILVMNMILLIFKICWWAYLNLCCVWMLGVQFITNFTIKTLSWKAEMFLKMSSQNAGTDAISETQI
jgi:hypothetical protein